MAVYAIYVATVKKLGFSSGKSGLATLFYVIKRENIDFIMGGKLKILKSTFSLKNISILVHSMQKDAE